MYRANNTILSLAFLLAGFASTSPAQTFSTIHGFTGYQDGANPAATLTVDGTGNLYGTTYSGNYIGGRDCGENGGCGIVFEMKRHNSAWVLTPLYSFTGFDDGAGPYGPVSFSNGLLYGTTSAGGDGNCPNGYFLGCGVVFSLQPPATACHTAVCYWTENPIYQFSGPDDGLNPAGNLVFDQAGNIYGITQAGGNMNCRGGCGTVYKLAHTGSGWVKSTLYAFTGGADGSGPFFGLVIDRAGNLYGTTQLGGAHTYGTVYELSPSGSGWIETVLYNFQNSEDGRFPLGGLVLDSAGNLYGTTSAGGLNLGGTVFEVSPSNGGWTFSVLYSLIGGGIIDGPQNTLTFDGAGNLYGTTLSAGPAQCGTAFKLTPSGGRWNYTDLHDFSCGSDGGYLVGGVALDAAGNLFGNALYYGPSGDNYCGVDPAPVGCGVVWEITP